MKLYVLIQDDRHYDTEVTVFADKAEARQTAAARMERDVNKYREDVLTVEQIATMGAMTAQQIPEDEHFGLNDSMIKMGWVWYCHAHDDGPSFWVVETELVK